MKYFNKLPNSVRYPLGLEWTLLKKLPYVFFLGTFLLCLPIISIYWHHLESDAESVKTIYISFGLLFSFWFFVGAIAIGCVVVMIMKGPGYVADPYELPKENDNLENHDQSA
jgi:hypothetical protein